MPALSYPGGHRMRPPGSVRGGRTAAREPGQHRQAHHPAFQFEVGMTYFARKTRCNLGHMHASRAEANRCYELHLLQDAGEISGLKVSPQYWFEINGSVVKHANGRRVGYKLD